MRYRVLALDPNSQHMPVPVLRKIRDMVNAGAVVVGPRRSDTPSLADDAAEFKAIADRLWGGTTGRGKVLTGSIADALASLEVAPDFEYTKPQTDTELAFVHRAVADGDVYWVIIGTLARRIWTPRSAYRGTSRSSGIRTRAPSGPHPTGRPGAALPCR